MKHWKIWLLLLLVPILVGCSSEPEEETPLLIGFSQSGMESNWRKAHTKSIVNELEKNDYQVLYRNGYMNQERQIQDIRTFIAYQVDMIIFSPLTESGWEPVLKEAKQAGIPVILVDRQIQVADKSLYETHIGPSFKAEGHRAGIFINNYFDKSSEEAINILELAGLADASPTILRSEGVREWIHRDSRMKVVDTIYGDFIRMKGKDVLTEYLKHHDLSQIDVLFSHNDEMTHGALQALAETDLLPGKDLVIVTIDGQNSMVQKLKQGQVNCIVECNPEVGFDVVNVVNRYFSGFYGEHQEKMPKEVYIYETVFTEQSLGAIPSRNY